MCWWHRHFVHFHLGLRCQLGVGPHMCCEARKGCGCPPDSLIKLCVEREVVSDSGAQVCELMRRIELIFVSSHGWWWFGTVADCSSLRSPISMHRADYYLLIMHWKSNYYVDCCLPIRLLVLVGHLKCSLEWVARTKLNLPHIIPHSGWLIFFNCGRVTRPM